MKMCGFSNLAETISTDDTNIFSRTGYEEAGALFLVRKSCLGRAGPTGSLLSEIRRDEGARW